MRPLKKDLKLSSGLETRSPKLGEFGGLRSWVLAGRRDEGLLCSFSTLSAGCGAGSSLDATDFS